MYKNITSLIEHATSQGYRSNVVKPLSGMIIILLLCTVTLFYLNFPFAAYIAGGIAILNILCFYFSYFFCLYRNPDLLRSERYNLEKTAIEKVAITGDSVGGKVQLPHRDYVLVNSQNGTTGSVDVSTNATNP